MVMTSDQISAMTAGFQMQSMAQMQNAAMISQQAGMGMPTAESAMGGMINRGAAIGAPLASAGLGLMGLDPFSIGLRGAMMGGARMGVAGAIGGGAMGAGLAAAPLMAASYAGSQMLGGMQEQQMLGGMLRSSYNFSTPGGRGFSSGDMGQIGQLLRQMSNQRGPGGEMTSFGELSQMASTMNRMGMAKGVTDAREFNDKFKQMMATVKEIATSFSTTLEEAQQVMVSMKSSGIFRNQGAVAGQIRGYALGGNIATSEITSMMGIGSQIARSIGGRGQAGAMGGMHTIGQVGLAQRFGTLSEEDIYNSTGLTGAEGRQAMATQMMQSSAQFLRGGLGRRFLASVAGKGGTLDEGSIAEYMHGGVGTGQTMQMAHRNLAGVGRADFIRNEGRLRGEALGKFGGLTNAVAMRGWLEERGFDLSSGQDDRAMIFMQRRLGMGTEEASNMVKMARDLPLLMKGQKGAMEEAQFNQSIDVARQHHGLAGVKRELESARGKVQNALKQAGAEYYQQGSNMLERWVNQLTGAYYQDISTDIIPAIRQAMAGGAAGNEALTSRFGLRGFGGQGLKGQQYFEQYRSQVFGQTKGVDAASFKGGLLSRGAAGAYEDAGYKIDTTSNATIEAGLKESRSLLTAYRTGDAEGIDRKQYAAYEQMGAESRDDIRRMAAHGKFRGRGRDRLKSFMGAMKDSNQTWLTNMEGLSEEQQMAIMGATMRGAGLRGFSDEAMGLPEDQFLFSEGAFRTKKDRDTAIGEYMLRNTGDKAISEQTSIEGLIAKGPGGMQMAVAGRAFDYLKKRDIGGLWNDIKSGQVLRDVSDYASNRGGRTQEAAGDFLMSEKGQELSRNVLSRDKATSKKAVEENQSRMIQLQTRAIREAKTLGDLLKAGSGDVAGLMNIPESGEYEARRSVDMADALSEALEKYNGDIPDDVKEKLTKDFGASSWDDFASRGRSVLASAGHKQRKDREQLFKRVGAAGVALKEKFETSGLTSRGRLTEGGGKMSAIGMKRGMSTTTAGQRFLQGMAEMAENQSMVTEFSSQEEAEAYMLKAQSAQQNMDRALSDMTVKEKRALARQMRAAGGPDEASNLLLATSGIQAKLDKARGFGAYNVKSGKVEKAIAQELGVDINREDMRAFQKGDIGSLSEIIGKQAFGDKFGAGQREDLEKAIKLTREGKQNEAANIIEKLQGTAVEARKDREENADPTARKLGELKGKLDEIKGVLGKSLTVEVSNTDAIANAMKKDDQT